MSEPKAKEPKVKEPKVKEPKTKEPKAKEAKVKDYLVHPVEKGTISISEEVVAAIAALAVSEVEGVFGLSSSFTADLKELLGRKNLSKGVKLTIEEDVVSVECFVVVTYGAEIPAVAAAIQENVISAVESMAGLKVGEVNVDIVGISAAKE